MQSQNRSSCLFFLQSLVLCLFPSPTLAMLPDLVQRDPPLPHLPNEILLQIISILESNCDDIFHTILHSFLLVPRSCYSMTFQALCQCPYLTNANSYRFKTSLALSGYGSMVKRLHLRSFFYLSCEDLIIQECKDGLKEFIAIESSLSK